MVRVTIDSATLAKLHNLDSYLELCDESGQLIGHFLPTEEHTDPIVDEVRRVRETHAARFNYDLDAIF